MLTNPNKDNSFGQAKYFELEFTDLEARHKIELLVKLKIIDIIISEDIRLDILDLHCMLYLKFDSKIIHSHNF